MTLAFFLDSVPFTADVIEGRASLGGSESACLQLARALSLRGHKIHLFATKLDPACAGKDQSGVTWHDAGDLEVISDLLEWDVFVSLRMPYIFQRPIRARLRVLWNQDLMDKESFKLGVMRVAWALDQIVYVSDFHRKQWEERVPELAPIGWASTNCFDPESLPQTAHKDPNRIIHISRPERGLGPLLQMWPALKAQRPNATLHLCRYSSMYDQGPGSWSDVCASFDREVERLNTDVGGITYLGELNKPQLYQAISNAAVMWYPGIPTFAETSCIAAIEAQACGTPFVGSYKGALPETVPSGTLVPGNAYTVDYQLQSVQGVIELLDGCAKNTVAYRRKQAEGRKHAQSYRADALAARWETWIAETFEARYQTQKLGVLRALMHFDDHTAAKQVADELAIEAPSDEITAALAQCDRSMRAVESGPTEFATTALDPRMEMSMADNPRITKAVNALDGAKHVLDIACGSGAYALSFLQADPERWVTAIDYAQGNIDALETAAKELGVADRLTAICASVWDFDKQDFTEWWDAWTLVRRNQAKRGDQTPFDGLFCGEFVEHVANYQRLIDGIEAPLKPNAAVCFTCPSGPLGELITRDQPHYRTHVHHFASDDLQAVWGAKKDVHYQLIHWATSSPTGFKCGNWVISYRATGAKSGPRDYAHRIRTTRPWPSLSVGIITKNAEHDLLRCLDSVWAFADEILIGDTGSIDSTPEILKAFTRKVQTFPLDPIDEQPDGFAGARNAVLARATGEWFFWIDTDEICVGGHKLRSYLEASVFHGYAIDQTHLQVDAPVHADTPVRIFRRRPDVQFYGCIHEQPQMGDCNGEIIPSLHLTDVQVAHTGYLVEAIRHEKMLFRNFPLLQKDRQRFPDRRLGKLLVVRDLVQMADRLGKDAGYEWPPDSRDWFGRAIALFEAEFPDPADRFHQIGRAFYHRALEAMNVGFEMESALAGRMGGLSQDHAKPLRFRVRTPEQFKRYMDWQVKEVLGQMITPPLRTDPFENAATVGSTRMQDWMTGGVTGWNAAAKNVSEADVRALAGTVD